METRQLLNELCWESEPWTSYHFFLLCFKKPVRKMHPTTLMFFWAVSLAEVRQGMIDRTAWDDYFSWCADNYSCVPHGVVHDFLASHAV